MHVINYKIYETSDGRQFEDEAEAVAWQNTLDIFETILILDSNMKRTTDTGSAFYISLETEEQVYAFNEMQQYEGITSLIQEPGEYYYNESCDLYLDIDKEIKTLQNMINTLNSYKKTNKGE